MFQSSNGINIPFPETSAVANLQEIERDEQKLYRELMTNQYINFINLGINYIEDILIDTDTFEEMFMYVQDNYFPIYQADSFTEHPGHLQLFGRFTYEFLCVDLLNWILPKTCTSSGFKTCLDLRSIEIPALREKLLRTIVTRLNNLKAIDDQSSIPQTRQDLYKLAYYVDVVDNDISGLVENFIIPVINRYEVVLDSTILS